MLVNTSRTASIVLLAGLLLAVTGCSSAGSATPIAPTAPTATVVPTTSAPATKVAEAGPITTPASGSATRAAILKAASSGLGVSGTLTVYQLYVQDGAAVGDVLPAGGSRTFFALSGGPDEWDLAWSARFGSTLANTAALTKADPELFTALAKKLDFSKKAPTTAAKPAAPTLASFKAYALKSAKSFAGTTYTGAFTIQSKIAKDSTGAWWGNAIAEPSGSEDLEAIGVWGRYSGGKWTGEIADFSTDGADAGFFPGDVLSDLAL